MVGDRSKVPVLILPERPGFVDRGQRRIGAGRADGQHELRVRIGGQMRGDAALHFGRVHHALQHRHFGAETVGEAAAAVVEADVADLVIDADRLGEAERLHPLAGRHAGVIFRLAHE